MLELLNEDIFNQIDKADAITIPTNCTLLENGTNPMGALAGAAARRWEEVPEIYGLLLSITPNVPCILGYISRDDHSNFISVFDDLEGVIPGETHTALVAFPTMEEITEDADLGLVIRSAKLLVEMANIFGWKKIYGGRFGCGVGGLSYELQVRPALSTIFDDRFIVMHKEPKGMKAIDLSFIGATTSGPMEINASN
jgi:hypothetical protein